MTDVNRASKSFQTFPEARRGPCDLVRAIYKLSQRRP